MFLNIGGHKNKNMIEYRIERANIGLADCSCLDSRLELSEQSTLLDQVADFSCPLIIYQNSTLSSLKSIYYMCGYGLIRFYVVVLNIEMNRICSNLCCK